MGVPRFFKWLIDNYPENRIIMSDLNDTKIDRLFLDANGIFHPQCFKTIASYPDLTNVAKLEKLMIKRIIKYIDYLFTEVNPQKELFISVDGVAPLAKMNQQRKRRFRSVDDNEIRKEIKKKHGVVENNIWSNTVITPGTVFMEQLMDELKKYANKKQKDTKILITVSDYHRAGEGEHKIMSYIRDKIKTDPHEKYVISGLDADLIFLSLATHHPNIFLMRETAQMGKTGKKTNGDFLKDPDDVSEDVNYINIEEMKLCYIEQLEDLVNQKSKDLRISIKISDVDRKKLITDFIFICYLLGNDFLPHIPSLGIDHGGLDRILNVYSEIFLMSSKKAIITPFYNISKHGDCDVIINQPLLLELLKKLSEYENTYFTVDLPQIEAKKQHMRCWATTPLERDLWNLEYMKCFKINDPIKLGSDAPDMWRFRYYHHYFKTTRDQSQLIDNMCHNFYQGLVWVTMYYLFGCVSWNWQYRYTHSPLLSDLYSYLQCGKIDLNKITFSPSYPLSPCVQLLAVLPPACSNLLPYNYQKLTTELSKSPIGDLYPTVIELDMLYKLHYWECIPMLPPVDPLRLIKATEKIKLSSIEKQRDQYTVDLMITTPRIQE
jgi:5'-3' exoribonuclease 2